MRSKLQNMLDNYTELTAKLGDPAILSDQTEYTRLAKLQRSQAQLAEKAREYLRRRSSWTRPGSCSSRRATPR